MASINLDLHLQVLSPLHVGGSDDKHLSEGIDYIQSDGMVYILDQKKMLQKIDDLQQYCNAIEKGKAGLRELLKIRRISLYEISLPPKPISGTASEIKACIKNGMDGKAYIPGSSVKGAIRSILFAKLFADSGISVSEAKGMKGIDSQLLGAFQDSLMRFIQCSDVHFDKVETILCNAKVFNLHSNRRNTADWNGGWKHGTNYTNSSFQPEGFTFAFECIPPEAIGKFRLSFDENLLYLASKDRRLNIKESFKQIFKEGFQTTLFKLIDNHTQSHIKREVSFFSYPGYQIAESELIVSRFEAIKQSSDIDAPILRMASGSGFHGITGDWQYSDHVSTGKTPRGVPRYKSRRLNFEKADASGYSFSPMGFVQFCTPEHYEKELKPAMERRVAKAKAEAEKAEKMRLEKIEAERRAAEEARKPVMQDARGLNKGKLIDAEVIGQQGIQLQVRPYVEGFTDKVLLVRYPAGMEKGTIIQITAKLQGKQLILSGAPKIKK